MGLRDCQGKLLYAILFLRMRKNMTLVSIIGALLLFGFGGSLYAQTSVTEYKVAVGGTSYGPYGLATLKEIAQSGTLTGNTPVWRAGMPEWVQADTVSELAALIAAVPREYKVAVDGTSYGPYGLATLKEIAQNGTLTGKTPVWKAGMPEWVQADTIPELAALIAPAPLLSPAPVPAPAQVLGTPTPPIRDFHQVGHATQQLDVPGLGIAHSSLPLGIQVQVTNPQNGQAVIAAVVGRIPVSANRIADLSRAAALGIGMEDSISLPIILEIVDNRRGSPQPQVSQQPQTPAPVAAAPGLGPDNPFSSFGISDEYLRRLIKTSNGDVQIFKVKLQEVFHAAEIDDSILYVISDSKLEDLIKRDP
jgi:hypothetical protein